MKSFLRVKRNSDTEVYSAVDSFSEWYNQFVKLVETRVYSETFEKLVDYLSVFDGEIITRLTEDEKDEQLILCSQYKYSLLDIAKEIKMYLNLINDEFSIWQAKKYEALRLDLLEEQKQEITDGYRSKGRYGEISQFTLKQGLLNKYGRDWKRWRGYINKIEKSHIFILNMLEDMETRANSIKNLNNKHKSIY